MTSIKEKLDLDFVELFKSLNRMNRTYFGEIIGSPKEDIVSERSFGLADNDDSYYIITDAKFDSKVCASAYYGKYLRLNFYLNESLLRVGHYGMPNVLSGDIVAVRDPRKIEFNARPGLHVLGLAIAINPEVLFDKYGLAAERLKQEMRSGLLGQRPVPIATKIDLSSRCGGAVETLRRCIVNDALHDRFLSAKSQELICEFVYSLNRPTSLEQGDQTYRSRSQLIEQKIHAAAHIYEQNMSHAPSIEKVSTMLGVNKNLLIDGFKEIYGTTPKQYFRKIAMEWARDQLKTGMYQVQEVAYLSGYKNASSFSRAYIAYFGSNPRDATK